MTAPAPASLWTPWGKGFTRRSSPVALRAPSDERRRLFKEAREFLALRRKRKKFVRDQNALTKEAAASSATGD